MRWLACIMTLLSLTATAALAQDQSSTPPTASASALELAGAYQSGYLQVVAVSCYQLYSSTGIIQTNLVDGLISPATALTALEHNSLLHSVCLTTISDIRSLTPQVDTEGLAELDRLLAVLTAEGELMRALQDFATNRTDASYAAVGTAQEQVEAALARYAGENQVGLRDTPAAGG